MEVLGRQFTGLLDSGANCSLLGGKFVKIAEELELRRVSLAGGIRTADGTEHRIQSFVRLPIAYNNKTEIIPVLLLQTLPDCIIFGMNFWNVFGVKAVCCTLELDKSQDDTTDEDGSEEAEEESLGEEHRRKLSTIEKQILQQTIAEFPKAEKGKLGRTDLYTHRIDIGSAQPKNSATTKCPNTCWTRSTKKSTECCNWT